MSKIFLLLLFISLVGCEKKKEKVKVKDPTLPENNIVFDVPDTSILNADEMFFSVEIYTSDIKKNEFRTATGSIIMDRLLCPRKILGEDRYIYNYPSNYGIALGRFNIDADPLDLLVLGMKDTYKEMVNNHKITPRKVKIVGIVKMEECDTAPCVRDDTWIQDWKILAVDIEDPIYGKMNNFEDVPKEKLNEIKEFFSNYKGPKILEGIEHPLTRVNGYLKKDEALRFINANFKEMTKEERNQEVTECKLLFRKTRVSKIEIGKLDKKFLHCVQRVHSDEFIPGNADYDFFMTYIPYQHLLKLGEPNATPENAHALMAKRRSELENYYRYVRFDEPSPGTMLPIWEWVKTKNVNSGCAEDFDPQHYASQPIF